MPAAVCIENLFAIESALDRPAGEHRELGDDDLVREGIGLSTEASAVCRSDHADPVHRQLEHLRQGAVHVMDDLGRRPERHLAVDKRRDSAVLLHRQVRVALKEEDVLADMLGAAESVVHISELQRHELVDIVGAAVVLDPLVFRGL